MSYTGWSLRRRGSFLLALVLGLVVLADWLFYERPIGWTVGLYAAALLLAVTLRGGSYFRGWPGRVTAAVMLGLVVALVIHPGVLAVGLSLLGLITLAAIDRGGWTSSVAGWAKRWAVFVFNALTQALRDVVLHSRWARSHHGRSWRSGDRRSLVSARAWGVPVALSLVFIGLFGLANPVVQRWIEQGWDALSARVTGLSEWMTPDRMALWGLTAYAVWGLLRARVRADRPRTDRGIVERPVDSHTNPKLSWNVGTSLVVRCLVLFNVVFGVQTLLDARYLLGGAALPDGMTYAEYAQRGAYPLVATALLAGLFVLLTFRPGGAAQRSAWCRRLVGLWVAQNVVLMVAAAWRLHLYVEAYSLTRWRVAAAVWMLLVGLGFGWLIWRILADRDNGWLLQRVTLTAGLVLYGVCFVDVDGRIADYNVAHCAEVGGDGLPIDLAYLETLGPAALPATQRLIETWREDATVVAVEPPAELWTSRGYRRTDRVVGPASHAEAEALALRLERELDRSMSDWRGWTWRRAKLSQHSPRTLAAR